MTNCQIDFLASFFDLAWPPPDLVVANRTKMRIDTKRATKMEMTYSKSEQQVKHNKTGREVTANSVTIHLKYSIHYCNMTSTYCLVPHYLEYNRFHFDATRAIKATAINANGMDRLMSTISSGLVPVWFETNFSCNWR